MADVVTLPGVFRPDAEQPCDPAACLNSALDAGLRDGAIIGRSISGTIEIWGSQPDADAIIGLLTRGINHLAEREQVQAEE